MSITDSDINDLVETTLQDMPTPPIDMVIGACQTDEDAKIMAEFIKKHYSVTEILEALEKHLEFYNHWFLDSMYSKGNFYKKKELKK